MCYSHGVDAIIRAKEVDAAGYTKEERFNLQQEFSMERGESVLTQPTNGIQDMIKRGFAILKSSL